MNSDDWVMARERQEQDFWVCLWTRVIVGVVICTALIVGCTIADTCIKRHRGMDVVECDEAMKKK